MLEAGQIVKKWKTENLPDWLRRKGNTSQVEILRVQEITYTG